MSLLQHYETYGYQMTEAEAYCFSHLINTTIDEDNSTIQKFADALHVSTTTIFRMCKNLGYASFKAFRFDLLYYQRDGFAKEDTIPDELAHIRSQTMDTFHLLEQSDMDPIVQSMLEAEKVLICSTGMNNYIAKILSIKLSLIGVNNIYPEDQWFMFLETNHLRKNDFVIVLSRAGETTELIKVVKSAQLNGVKTLLIGETGHSTLEDLADFKLSTSKVENEGYDIDTRLQMHVAVHYLTKKVMAACNALENQASLSPKQRQREDKKHA